MGKIVGSLFGGGGARASTQAASAAGAGTQEQIKELRRQFDITQKQFKPFLQAGTAALPGVTEGTTAGGLGDRLSRIFDTDIFSSLRGERESSVRGQLAAGGLTRSGAAIEEIADIPTQLGLALEQLLTGRSQQLAGIGQSSAAGLGQIGAESSRSIGQALAQGGQQQASGILGAQQSRASGASNLLSLGTSLLGGFFSDPRLKANMEQIGEVGGLPFYQWDWIPEAGDTVITHCPTVGFSADEVEKVYPNRVGEFGGWLFINYPGLLDDLEVANSDTVSRDTDQKVLELA